MSAGLQAGMRCGVVILACLMGCGGARAGVRGEGGDFVELYPLAQKLCDAELVSSAGGREVRVLYPKAAGEDTARRFVASLEAYQQEVESDYEMLRSHLATHLGDELWLRVKDRPYLHAPVPTKVWYLVPSAATALMWRGPVGSRWHLLGTGGPPYPDAVFTLRSNVQPQVHEFTHGIMHELLSSKRGRLPRWYEEGMCDWASMHFQRWKEKKWDGPREVLARATWQRDEVRRQLLAWPHGGVKGSLEAWREKSWESDLLYKGSLGLIFAIETERGSAGPLEILKKLLAASPETDREARAILERELGKPLDQLGIAGSEQWARLRSSLLDDARKACTADPGERPASPIAALGHFPEGRDEIVPVLRSLVSCKDTEIASQALSGLRYLGERRLLAEAVSERCGKEKNAVPPEGMEGACGMARGFVAARGKAVRWFGDAAR